MNSGIGIIWAPVGIFVAVVGMVWFVKRLKKKIQL